MTRRRRKGKKKLERPKLEDVDGVDFISNMPDHILVLILSRLFNIKEQIRSSILSKRWRYLWTAIPSLDLDIDRFRNKKRKFEEFTNWVLANVSVDLDRFGLYCPCCYNMSTVSRWIQAAVMRNVKQLHLSFCPENFDEQVGMPDCLVTCASLELLELNLTRRGLRLPNIMGFPALRVLELTNVDLLKDDDLVTNFLGSCPLLEELTLMNCWMCELNLVCISCVNLKKLYIMNAHDFDDDGMCGALKVFCPKLVSFYLMSYVAYNYFFESLHSLKEAVIQPNVEGINTNSVLFPGISHVESLMIDLYFFTQCINAERDPALPNLKTLMLTTTMDNFTMDNFNRVLKHYPKLESLELIIEQDFSREVHEGGDAQNTFTRDLKRIRSFEFNGEKPKLVIERDEMVSLELVLVGGNKTKYSH